MKYKGGKQRFDEQNLKNRFLGQTLFNKYKIVQYIDKGHFGVLFKAKILTQQQILQNQLNQETVQHEGVTLEKKKTLYEQLLNDSEESQFSGINSSHINGALNMYVAVKIEDFIYQNNGQNYKQSHLYQEVEITKRLQGNAGFPKLYDYSFNESEGIMILQYMKTSLQKLFNLTEYASNMQSQQQIHSKSQSHYVQQGDEKEFSLQTVVLIGMQMIDRLEILHEKGFLHRDIKPDNMMIGNESLTQSTIYLLDFGISKSYLTKDNKHIPFTTKAKFAGTQKFSSIAADQGLEQGRKDDLEALGYVLIYFLKGTLPWCGIRDAETVKQTIQDIKKNTDIQELCEDINYEFWKYFKYLKTLKFEDKPNYQYIKNLFREIIQSDKLYQNFYFDWQIEDSALKTLVTHQTVMTSLFRPKSQDDEIEQEDEKQIQNYFQKQASLVNQQSKGQESVITAGMMSRKQSIISKKTLQQNNSDSKLKCVNDGDFKQFKDISLISEVNDKELEDGNFSFNEEIPSEDPQIIVNLQNIYGFQSKQQRKKRFYYQKSKSAMPNFIQ